MNQKVRKLQKKINTDLEEQKEGSSSSSLPPLPPLVDISVLYNDADIDACLQEFDNLTKERKDDPLARAARNRLQRRLQLRQHELKAQSMTNELKDTLSALETSQQTETLQLLGTYC